jgi:AraC family transcriptional regulator of adaptative response/methylated-DNA-[protein]-cysteine methyltransferase
LKEFAMSRQIELEKLAAERSAETPSLEKLAKHAGMSAFHLHRIFKAITGLTPIGYGAAHRTKRVRKFK